MAGFSGEQFATPEAIGLLRDVRRKPPTAIRLGVGRRSAQSPRHHDAGRETAVARRQSAAVPGRLAGGHLCCRASPLPGGTSREEQWEAHTALLRRHRRSCWTIWHRRAKSARGTHAVMDPSRRRQGGRGRRVEGSRVPQLPWTEVDNPYPPMEVLSADQIEAIHLTSLRILEESGDGGDVGARPGGSREGRRASRSGDTHRAPGSRSDRERFGERARIVRAHAAQCRPSA